MARHVGFIDFGFLKSAAARTLHVEKRRLHPHPDGCVAWLKGMGATISGDAEASLFLRAYWYDGAYDPRDPNHGKQRTYFDAIAQTPGVQLRLGHIQKRTPKWQYAVKTAVKNAGIELSEFEKHFEFRAELGQKGVDTRITLDLVRLAERRVYDTAVLIAGDRDLAEPVRVAQDEGRRVIVAIPRRAGLAQELKHLADEVRTLETTDLKSMFTIKPPL